MLTHSFEIQTTLHILDVTAKTAEANDGMGHGWPPVAETMVTSPADW